MARIVALDTCTEFGSLALWEDGRILEESILHAPDGFGHILFPHLERLLARHGWTYRTVTGYVAGAGPGSFTGIRVALAAVKGLAEATGAGAAAVSNLRALASFGRSSLRAPFLDARRGEIYGGLFDGALEPLSEEVASPLPSWLAGLPPDAELITNAPEPFRAAIVPRVLTEAPRALAGALAHLGYPHLGDPVALDANYIRRSDAELHWRET